MTSPAAHRQSGIAVLTAMLIVAIATILVVELVWDRNLGIRRTENYLLREQAQEIARGMELLAAELLERDLEDDPNIDSLNETWADDYAFPFDGGNVVGKLADLQGRFNLNALLTPDGEPNEIYVERFRRLVELTVSDAEIRDVIVGDVVDAVIDWIDVDQVPELGGAEDGIYTREQPPYRAANFWFTSPSELQAVNGVSAELYQALESQLSALPVSGGQTSSAYVLNVNTAEPLVLQALSADVTPTIVEDWLANRQSQPYETQEEFWDGAADLLDDAVALRPTLGVSSSYFGLTVIVSIGTTRLAMYSLLERSSQGVVARLRAFDTI